MFPNLFRRHSQEIETRIPCKPTRLIHQSTVGMSDSIRVVGGRILRWDLNCMEALGVSRFWQYTFIFGFLFYRGGLCVTVEASAFWLSSVEKTCTTYNKPLSLVGLDGIRGLLKCSRFSGLARPLSSFCMGWLSLVTESQQDWKFCEGKVYFLRMGKPNTSIYYPTSL